MSIRRGAVRTEGEPAPSRPPSTGGPAMTQYMLSVATPAEGGQPPTPDELTAIMARVGEVEARVKEAGAWVFAGGLAAPSSATVLRPQGDDVLVVDGPFAEGKEYLGGFSVIDVGD